MKNKFILLFVLFSISILHAASLLHAEPNAKRKIRIMPLGDSITYDQYHSDVEGKARPKSIRAAYRAPLWYGLEHRDYNVNFVGSRSAGKAITPPFDTHNEGYPGATSYDIAEKVYSFLKKNPPHIILLHIGTNDYSTSIKGVESILNEIDRFEHDSGKKIRVILALIIDKVPSSIYIKGFNHNLENLFEKRWENGDIITLVNMYKGAKLTKNNYVDGTHPTPTGYKKMATVWFNAITTPYLEYTSAPITQDDIVEVATGSTVHIDILANDKDRQNDMNISSVLLSKKKNTKRNKATKKLKVSKEGEWKVSPQGIVTFTPNKNFTADPKPIYYTLKDKENELSKPAKIKINYTNSSLESYPTSLVSKSYIKSISIDEAHNSIKFTTAIPTNGITF